MLHASHGLVKASLSRQWYSASAVVMVAILSLRWYVHGVIRCLTLQCLQARISMLGKKLHSHMGLGQLIILAKDMNMMLQSSWQARGDRAFATLQIVWGSCQAADIIQTFLMMLMTRVHRFGVRNVTCSEHQYHSQTCMTAQRSTATWQHPYCKQQYTHCIPGTLRSSMKGMAMHSLHVSGQCWAYVTMHWRLIAAWDQAGVAAVGRSHCTFLVLVCQ